MNPAALESKHKKQKAILNFIIRRGEVPRPAIAEHFGLSTATITNLVSDLIELGIVYEGRSENAALGRKAKMLCFNAALNCFVAVDIADKNRIELYACDLLGGTLRHETCIVDLSAGPGGEREEQAVLKIIEAVTGFISRLPEETAAHIAAVGISIPGMVGKGETIYAPFLNWEDFPLVKPLQAALHLPVYFDNVTRIKGTYEYRHLDENLQSAAYLSMTPGLGLAFFFEGALVRGATGIAGEFGHTTIDVGGEPCYCGNRGCLESFCGELSVIERCRKLCSEDEILRKALGQRGGLLTVETMIAARRAGSVKVHHLFREVGKYLGIAITNIVNTIDPQAVVVSGNIVENDDFVYDIAVEEAKSRMINRFSRDNLIKRGVLRENEYEKAICAFLLTRLFDQIL